MQASFKTHTCTRLSWTHTYIHFHPAHTHMPSYMMLIFLPSCRCVVHRAGQKCQRSRELGKEGLINGDPLSTAMPLRAALWLHIALLPNEAQLLDEYNGFALELRGIMARNLPPLSASLFPSVYSQHSALAPFSDSLPALCPAQSAGC